jgi:hypothetical protein
VWDVRGVGSHTTYHTTTTNHNPAGERFLAENFDELVKEKLMKQEDDDDQELDEEGLRQKLLRSPYARLLDPTFRK